MRTANEYFQRFQDLGVDGMDLSVSTLDEAKRALQTCRSTQRELRQMKRDINADLKLVRQHHKEITASAGSGMATALRLFGKRKLAGSISADAKRAARSDRDAATLPYERLKRIIDDVINQLDRAKLNIENWIEEAREEEEATKPPVRATSQKKGPKVDVIDQIERLGKLREAGVLTEEEFDAKKRELLSKL